MPLQKLFPVYFEVKKTTKKPTPNCTSEMKIAMSSSLAQAVFENSKNIDFDLKFSDNLRTGGQFHFVYSLVDQHGPDQGCHRIGFVLFPFFSFGVFSLSCALVLFHRFSQSFSCASSSSRFVEHLLMTSMVVSALISA